jgi:hypothetical protein
LKTAILTVAFALTLVTGCSRGSETWQCHNAAKHSCSQWTEPDADTRKKQQASCVAMGGVAADGPCPEENVIGSCTAQGAADSRIVYYAPRSVEEARLICGKLAGIWR